MAKQPGLPLEARRIRMIIVSAPIMVASCCQLLVFFPSFFFYQWVNPDVLYKRLVLGEEQRQLPHDPDKPTINIRVVESDRRDKL
jgi:hypothetical protein